MRAPRLALPAILALVTACAGPVDGEPTPRATVSGTPGPPPAASVVGDAAVLQAGDIGDYDFVLPGAMLIEDGTWHAWVVGFGQERGDQSTAHLTSTDGVAWEVRGGDLAEELGVEFSPPGPIPGSVLRLPDDRWGMYFSGTAAPTSDRSAIWLATAAELSGPWVADAEPVLQPAALDAWDGRALDFPSVVRASDGSYLMAYGGDGFGAQTPTEIGFATSTDGREWTRQAAEPGVAAGSCGAFDVRGATQPRLLAGDDGGFRLLYAGQPETGDRPEVGLVTSDDGLTWRCAVEEPILVAADIPGSGGIHTIAATTDASSVPRILVESLIEGRSEIWLARLD